MALALLEGPARTGTSRRGRPVPLPARPVGILGAASAIGARDQGCSLGPDSLRAADLTGTLRAGGVPALWDDIIRRPGAGGREGDPLRLRDFCRDLGAAVGAVLRRGLRPVIVGGDHSSAIATWGAVRQALPGPLGLVWIDAHMDSHTPETSPSGALHGMPLAVLLGHGAAELTALGGPGPKLLPQHVALLGVRSFEPAEATLLERRGVRVFMMRELGRRGLRACLEEALAIARHGTAAAGLSLDLDAVDPSDAPGVGTPVPGGIPARDLIDAVTGLSGRQDLIAIEIAELNPIRDHGGKTTALVVELLAAALCSDQYYASRHRA